MRIKKAGLNRITAGDILNLAFLTLFTLICIYPFWYIFIGSISNPNIPTRTLVFLPKEVTLFNYIEVLKLKGLLHAGVVSVLRTFLGTALAVLLTSFMAYLFTLSKLPARRFFYRFVIITMYVNGGLIPTFITYKMYGLTNSFWVYIFPGAVSAFHIVLIKTFLEGNIPESLNESAVLDGAGVLKIYSRIIFPLSKPILATIALFSAVNQWNSWFDNMIYNSGNNKLLTLQYLLYQRLNEASRLAEASRSSSISDIGKMLNDKMVLTPDAIRMTITIIVTIPILCLYPFVQRYFVKGIMVGAVKG